MKLAEGQRTNNIISRDVDQILFLICSSSSVTPIIYGAFGFNLVCSVILNQTHTIRICSVNKYQGFAFCFQTEIGYTLQCYTQYTRDVNNVSKIHYIQLVSTACTAPYAL
jgi:hypothetical protein